MSIEAISYNYTPTEETGRHLHVVPDVVVVDPASNLDTPPAPMSPLDYIRYNRSIAPLSGLPDKVRTAIDIRRAEVAKLDRLSPDEAAALPARVIFRRLAVHYSEQASE